MLLLFSKQSRAPHAPSYLLCLFYCYWWFWVYVKKFLPLVSPCHIWRGKNPNAVTGNILTAKRRSSLKLKVPVSTRSQGLRYTGGNQLIEYRQEQKGRGKNTKPWKGLENLENWYRKWQNQISISWHHRPCGQVYETLFFTLCRSRG